MLLNVYLYALQPEFEEKHRRYFDFQRRTGQLPLQKEVSQCLVQLLNVLISDDRLVAVKLVPNKAARKS